MPGIEDVLYEERIIGYLDPGAERFLRALNSHPSLWTTSSCTGRITVVEGGRHWERGKTRVVYKTHDPITLGELLRVLSRPFRDLWLKATGPIIHFQTKSLRCAVKLLETARISGFKHSGIFHATREAITIEVVAPTRIDAPLRVRGLDLHTKTGLNLLVVKANEALLDGRKRLERLASALATNHPCQAKETLTRPDSRSELLREGGRGLIESSEQ